MADPITKDEVKHLIHEWGRLHDEHAPVSAYLPIIAEENFEIRFGVHVWKGRAGFAEHEEMKQQFFDETHLYNSIELVSATADQAMAKSVVTWEARTREAPAPRSTRIKAVIHHTWEFLRPPQGGNPVILRHVVDRFEYLPGCAPPTALKFAPHLNQPNNHKT
jgi:hypothetical protein